MLGAELGLNICEGISVLVRRLITEKHEVVVLQRKSADTCKIDDLKLSFHLGDATDPESLKGAMDGCDVVCHMAGFLAQCQVIRRFCIKLTP